MYILKLSTSQLCYPIIDVVQLSSPQKSHDTITHYEVKSFPDALKKKI